MLTRVIKMPEIQHGYFLVGIIFGMRTLAVRFSAFNTQRSHSHFPLSQVSITLHVLTVVKILGAPHDSTQLMSARRQPCPVQCNVKSKHSNTERNEMNTFT